MFNIFNLKRSSFKEEQQEEVLPEEIKVPDISEALIVWADRIVFVNKENLEEVEMYASDLLKGKEVQVLNIPDSFGYSDPTLRGIIGRQLKFVEPYIYGE